MKNNTNETEPIQARQEPAESQPAALTASLMEIGNCCATLPDLDPRSPEDLIGFDEFGIPV